MLGLYGGGCIMALITLSRIHASTCLGRRLLALEFMCACLCTKLLDRLLDMTIYFPPGEDMLLHVHAPEV